MVKVETEAWYAYNDIFAWSYRYAIVKVDGIEVFRCPREEGAKLFALGYCYALGIPKESIKSKWVKQIEKGSKEVKSWND